MTATPDGPEISVRPATVDDLTTLVALAADAAAELATMRGGPQLLRDLEPRIDHPAACRAAIDAPDAIVLCGLWQSFVVGYAVVHRIDIGDLRLARITELATTLEVRDLGIGEALVDAAVEWARDQDCAEIDAMALPGARSAKNLFERSGLVARALTVSRRLTDD